MVDCHVQMRDNLDEIVIIKIILAIGEFGNY